MCFKTKCYGTFNMLLMKVIKSLNNIQIDSTISQLNLGGKSGAKQFSAAFHFGKTKGMVLPNIETKFPEDTEWHKSMKTWSKVTAGQTTCTHQKEQITLFSKLAYLNVIMWLRL